MKNKVTWSISVFLLLISIFGCGRSEHTNVSEPTSYDAIVEKIDRVAAAEFKKLVEKNRNDIVSILKENNVIPANSPNPNKHVNWHMYKSADLYIENGMGTAKIVLSGWEKTKENKYQGPVTLWFERINRKWYLVVKEGHLTTAVSSTDEAYSLSPEIHDAFTTLFPCIEYEDWRKWKDPIRKELALKRLKTALQKKDE